MDTARWLFPFTTGMDWGAIDDMVCLAANAEATLVAVSLIAVPSERLSAGVRLERIQQSKDFLETIGWVAARYHVSIERHEVVTTDVLKQIALLLQVLECDSIALASRRGKETLLRAEELEQLLDSPPAPLLLLRLTSETKPSFPFIFHIRAWLATRLWKSVRHTPRERAWHDDESYREEPRWVRTEVSLRSREKGTYIDAKCQNAPGRR